MDNLGKEKSEIIHRTIRWLFEISIILFMPSLLCLTLAVVRHKREGTNKVIEKRDITLDKVEIFKIRMK